MANRDQAANELRAVAEHVATLLTKQAEHERHMDQMLALVQLDGIRAVSTAHRQDIRRKIIVGGAVLAEARANREFGTLLYKILARRVIDPYDRDFIARGDDKEAGVATTMPPVSTAPPSTIEFAALADRRLAKANSSDT